MKQLLFISFLIFLPFMFLEIAESADGEPQQQVSTTGEEQPPEDNQPANIDIFVLTDEVLKEGGPVQVSPEVWKCFVNLMENYYKNKGQKRDTDTSPDMTTETSESDCNFKISITTIPITEKERPPEE